MSMLCMPLFVSPSRQNKATVSYWLITTMEDMALMPYAATMWLYKVSIYLWSGSDISNKKEAACYMCGIHHAIIDMLSFGYRLSAEQCYS